MPTWFRRNPAGRAAGPSCRTVALASAKRKMIDKNLTRRRALGSFAAATSHTGAVFARPASARSVGAPSPDRVLVDMEFATAERPYTRHVPLG